MESGGAENSRSSSSGAAVVATVSSIFIYPVKSCRGISVPQAPVTPTGFRWDRQWLVVNAKGRACTQRIDPRLALVDVELPEEAFQPGWKPRKNSFLVLRAPGMELLKVSLSKPSEVVDGISIWEWTGTALDEGAEAANWFSKYIGKPTRLLRFNQCRLQLINLHLKCIVTIISIASSETREVDPDYASGYNIMFSDGYPFLLISQASLDALNELLKEPIPINRFRPNILVEGCLPFSEDLWKDIKINKLTFHGVKLCKRCKVPTINQENGIAGSEPTETLMKFRSDEVLRPMQKPQRKVYFGQNLICSDTFPDPKGKTVKVGDPVSVVMIFSSLADAPA